MNNQPSNKIKTFSFPEYISYVNQLSKEGSCTGEFSEEHRNSTQVYSRRMKRLFAQAEVNSSMQSTMASISEPLEWVVLAESWCGDGAYNLPLIARIAQLSDQVKLSVLLRNENQELMNAHLTNGSQSIPKLICVNAKTKKEIGSWGPRPQVIQNKVKMMREQNPSITHKEMWIYLHDWYSEDKGEALQNEFIVLINKWISNNNFFSTIN